MSDVVTLIDTYALSGETEPDTVYECPDVSRADAGEQIEFVVEVAAS